MKSLGQFEYGDDDELKARFGKGKVTTHISLFSGCGGLDLGFAKAGIETRAMVEFAHEACETLRANWHWEELKKRTINDHYETEDGEIYEGPIFTGPKTEDGRKLKLVPGELRWKTKEEFYQEAKDYYAELERRKQSKVDHADDYQFAMSEPPATWYHEREPVIFERDICTVTTEELLKASDLQIGECSIISGGFPCQGFSLAGQRVRDDPRNALYKEFVRIVDEAKPARVMGENVPGIVSMGQGEVIHQICEDFAACGYDVAWKILNAADYGVPQSRKRVIFIAHRIDAMRIKEDGGIAMHIAAEKGSIQHPYLFLERLKRWSRSKDKEISARVNALIKKIEEDPSVTFGEKDKKESKDL